MCVCVCNVCNIRMTHKCVIIHYNGNCERGINLRESREDRVKWELEEEEREEMM